MKTVTITQTHTTTHREDATALYEPAPGYVVAAIYDPENTEGPHGDYAPPATYFSGRGWPRDSDTTTATHAAEEIPAEILDYVNDYRRHHGPHLENLERALRILGYDAAVTPVTLDRSEWGHVVTVATPRYREVTGNTGPVEADPEFLAWLKGYAYRLAVLKQDEDGDWIEDERRPYWASIYADACDLDRGDYTDQARTYWEEWCNETDTDDQTGDPL